MSKVKEKHMPIPSFASEEEEIRFWDEHNPWEYFTEPADIIVRLKSRRKKMMSVRIEEDLQDELKAVAAEHGIPYQELMRELLRESLLRLRRSEKVPATP
jgi:predicted DNA binding CopG/RHH family protein